MMKHSVLKELPPASFNKDRKLTFELIDNADLLQYSLASSVGVITNAWRLATSYFGLIPANSVKDKFPYYRSAVGSSSTHPLPRELAWLQRTQKKSLDYTISGSTADRVEATALPPVQQQATVRPRRKSYPRDALTKPGTILLYNIVLAWAMFQVDVSASTF
jgi:hypothetical protein